MKPLAIMIPYCGNCSRKSKKEGLSKDECFCDVLVDTPMKGVVTIDTDGTRCVEMGVYEPIQQQKKHETGIPQRKWFLCNRPQIHEMLTSVL